jgi:hypothetical protein
MSAGALWAGCPRQVTPFFVFYVFAHTPTGLAAIVLDIVIPFK